MTTLFLEGDQGSW